MSVPLEFYFNLRQCIEKCELFSSKNNESDDILNKKISSPAAILIPLITPSITPLLNVDMGRVRLVLLSVNDTKIINKTGKFDLVIAQFVSLSLTSSLEYPVVRNFMWRSAGSVSAKIYNKYKSTGAIYRPGFAFEDRQYALECKNLAVFKSTRELLVSSKLDSSLNENAMATIVNSFNVRTIVGLPIVFANRLVNGYLLELSVLTPSLELHVGSESLNLVSSIVRENVTFVERLSTIARQNDAAASVASDVKLMPPPLHPTLNTSRLNRSSLHNQSK
jgi:hypothetical protein